MLISLKESVANRVTEALKKYIVKNNPSVEELFVNLGDIKTVRVLSFYSGYASIVKRELSLSLTSPISCPDATIWIWRETGWPISYPECLESTDLSLRVTAPNGMKYITAGQMGICDAWLQ